MLKHAAHPGEVLKDELADLRISPTELARQIDVSANSVSQIIDGKISISGDQFFKCPAFLSSADCFQ